jgi:response regulator RpfG family c-di-GMP phosphodiesterase
MSSLSLDLGDGRLFGVELPGPESSPIVLVDDEASVLLLLEKVLSREGYPVLSFESALKAIERIREGGVALLITDIRMPDLDGIELIRLALEEDPDLAVLILTGAADTQSAVEALRLGVEDYLQKPISVEEIVEATGRALRHRSQSMYRNQLESWLRTEVDRRTEQVRRQAEDIQQLTLATLTSLVRAMEAKDLYLKGHSQRVSQLAERIALRLEFAPREVEEVRVAGLLHDIGMIAIRESVLHKEGQLSGEEYRHVQEHVEFGADILDPLVNLGRVAEYVRCHHERLDGSGYPRQLQGTNVALGAQVVGLAEVFVSLTERRPHRQAFGIEQALETLKQGRGTWYDPRLFDALSWVLEHGNAEDAGP